MNLEDERRVKELIVENTGWAGCLFVIAFLVLVILSIAVIGLAGGWHGFLKLMKWSD